MEATSKCRLLLRRLEEHYAGIGPLPTAEPGESSAPLHAIARSVFEDCRPSPRGRDMAASLKPGWARCVEFRDPRARAAVERLASLPPDERFRAAPATSPEVAAEVIVALLDLAEAVRGYHEATASSLAQTALALSPLVGASAEDRQVFEEQAAYWISAAEDGLLSDRLGSVATRLDVAQMLADEAGADPALAARLGLARAQLYWQQARIDACLIELEAALAFCRAARDGGLRGTALYLKGLTLATVGRRGRARSCLEESLKLLPGTDEAWVLPLARTTLDELDWQL